MEREIKFRAWDGKRMLQNVGYHPSMIKFLKEDGYAADDEGAYIISPQFLAYKLMQYTGLKDKNGVEIYEGDVLAIRADTFAMEHEPIGHEVIFGNYSIGEDSWGLKHQTPCFCIKFRDGSGYCRIDEEVLVLGNVYETPVLLA